MTNRVERAARAATAGRVPGTKSDSGPGSGKRKLAEVEMRKMSGGWSPGPPIPSSPSPSGGPGGA